MIDKTETAIAVSPDPSAALGGDHKRRKIDKKNNIQERARDIWRRARINAFAHKNAEYRHMKRARLFFIGETSFALLSILFIITTFMISNNTATDSTISLPFLGALHVKFITFFTTIASVICSLIALFATVMNSHEKNDVKASEHKYLLGSYQHIAQKSRKVEWQDMRYKDMVWTLNTLEENFQLLKARGSEPVEGDFDYAHTTMKKIKGDKISREAQSFRDQTEGTLELDTEKA